jgi:DNA-binding response OmpR family regulator
MNDDASTILLVEDDDATRTYLADNLTADGYDLVVADTVREGARLIETKYPDLCVVDVGLPDGSGLDLLATVRDADGLASRVDPFTPMIVLSGRADEVDRVRGFERGADDYVAKPFVYSELRHRVAALLRRAQARRGRSRLRIGPLEIVPDAREVRVNGARVELSQKEYALLRALAEDPLRVCTKDDLLKSIWGFQARGRTRTLDSHACRLRAKLGEHGGRWVVNVWGVGYKLLEGAVA